jgi:hypothetical protein
MAKQCPRRDGGYWRRTRRDGRVGATYNFWPTLRNHLLIIKGKKSKSGLNLARFAAFLYNCVAGEIAAPPTHLQDGTHDVRSCLAPLREFTVYE